MSLTDGNGNDMVMPVQPLYGGGYGGYGGGFGGFGGDWGSLIVLFLIAAMFGGFGGGWGMGGFGGGIGGMYEFPWLLTGQQGINANTNAGFNQAATSSQLSGIQTSLTNGFANAEIGDCNRAMTQMQATHASQISELERSFAAQTALDARLDSMQTAQQNCCCENRLGTADLKATVLAENCADRAALQEGIRDIIANQTAGFQSIKDQLFSDKMDAKNDEIAQLRQEMLYARGQASQIAQNGTIVDGIYNRLNECPVGTVPVYGRQPIFQCGNGCGCGNNFGGFNGNF